MLREEAERERAVPGDASEVRVVNVRGEPQVLYAEAAQAPTDAPGSAGELTAVTASTTEPVPTASEPARLL